MPPQTRASAAGEAVGRRGDARGLPAAPAEGAGGKGAGTRVGRADDVPRQRSARRAGARARRAVELPRPDAAGAGRAAVARVRACLRSEEHTSELRSPMRSSYAVFSLKKKT